MKRARLATANGIVLAASLPARRRFLAAQQNPSEAQAQVLSRHLALIGQSAYGQAHGLGRVRDAEGFRAAAPIVRYDDLAPWIERIADGESNVLTCEPTLLFERTSGSSAAAKLIPYTRALLDQYDRAISAWLADLYLHRPALCALGSYWSISPLTGGPAVSRGGIAIGVEDDGEYLGPLTRRLIQATRLVPASVRRIPDLAECRYASLRYLLEDDLLGLVSVWSPSFWTLFCDALEEHGEALIRDVANRRRARELEDLLARDGRLTAAAVWPRLSVISCWTSVSAARQLPALRAHHPEVEIQGKGLLATEGVVSIPLTGYPGAALALTSHFLEFRPEGEASRTCLAHELEEGQDYEVILTTGSGLARYALGDLVRVVGRVGGSPLIELVGRADKVVDLCGEKLNEAFVATVLEQASERASLVTHFAMLAPLESSPPRYALFIETEAPDAALATYREAVAEGLRANPHYAYCEGLGQLGELVAERVEAGEARYLEASVARGQRAGDVKPTALSGFTDWRTHFS